MAKAKRCDLCRKFYELDELHDYKGHALRFLVENLRGEYLNNGSIVDCCLECAASIDQHIQKLKGECK